MYKDMIEVSKQHIDELIEENKQLASQIVNSEGVLREALETIYEGNLSILESERAYLKNTQKKDQALDEQKLAAEFSPF